MSLKQKSNLLSGSPNLSALSSGGGINIQSVRVKSIILDQNSLGFSGRGEWASLGGIFWSDINAPTPTGDINNDNFALPLFPNQKNFPLLEEIVYIIALPNTGIGESTSAIQYYYFQPINLWNSIHHNGYPPFTDSTLPESQQKDYQQVEGGSVRKVTDGSTEIKLGNTFKERLDVKSLLPYEGDIIYEGRWGNSIRFGSTVLRPNTPNLWSTVGEDGDPIIIIRNGQHNDGRDPWVPQLENINKDQTSIYLTSNQKIPIEVSSKNYTSYKVKPQSPSEYQGKQAIINSDRLLFNTKTDSILLSSQKTISLNARESVNIDAPQTIVQSPDIRLGDLNATEPIILGETFLTDLSSLLKTIILLSQALQTPIGTPVPNIPNANIPIPAVRVEASAQDMINRIEKYKSKISKTK
jgi:hypothetical protein